MIYKKTRFRAGDYGVIYGNSFYRIHKLKSGRWEVLRHVLGSDDFIDYGTVRTLNMAERMIEIIVQTEMQNA